MKSKLGIFADKNLLIMATQWMVSTRYPLDSIQHGMLIIKTLTLIVWQ